MNAKIKKSAIMPAAMWNMLLKRGTQSKSHLIIRAADFQLIIYTPRVVLQKAKVTLFHHNMSNKILVYSHGIVLFNSHQKKNILIAYTYTTAIAGKRREIYWSQMCPPRDASRIGRHTHTRTSPSSYSTNYLKSDQTCTIAH